MQSGETQRGRRVRFAHPVRITTLNGAPRTWRTISANLSRRGLFVRMPQPLGTGTPVALSFEAGGQVLPFARGEVRWVRQQESALDGRFQGCGVHFTDFLHPRAEELVAYLVGTLQTGAPLKPAPRRRRARWAAAVVSLCVVALLLVGWGFIASLRSAVAVPTPPARSGLEDPPSGSAVQPLSAPLAAEKEIADPASVAPIAETLITETPEQLGALVGGAVAVLSPTGPITETPEQLGALVGGAVAVFSPTGPITEMPERLSALLSPTGPITETPERLSTSAGAPAAVHSPTGPITETPERLDPPVSAADRQVLSPIEPVKTPEPAVSAADRQVLSPTEPVKTPERLDPPAGAASERQVLAPPGPTVETPARLSAPARAPSPSTVDAAVSPTRPSNTMHVVALPTGAATSVSLADATAGLEVRPALHADSRVVRVFMLTGPPRLVFDIEGRAPRRSVTVSTDRSNIRQVRVGAHGPVTRLVVDLSVAPRSVTTGDDHALIQF